jgi:hypothetical protein
MVTLIQSIFCQSFSSLWMNKGWWHHTTHDGMQRLEQWSSKLPSQAILASTRRVSIKSGINVNWFYFKTFIILFFILFVAGLHCPYIIMSLSLHEQVEIILLCGCEGWSQGNSCSFQ